MHLIDHCANCGGNVSPELGVVTATTVQHRECADRYGVGAHGSRPSFAATRAVRRHPRTVAFTPAGRV